MFATKNSLLIDAQAIFTKIANAQGFLTARGGVALIGCELIDAQGLAKQWLERFDEVMATVN